MRTILIRSSLALAVLLSVAAVPAFAQSVMRGKVVDAQGKPVPDAVVLFEARGGNRTPGSSAISRGCWSWGQCPASGSAWSTTAGS